MLYPKTTPIFSRLLFLLLFPSVAFSKNESGGKERPISPINDCGVTANFTPSNDSVILAPYFSITFVNTSVNADGVTWFIDGLYQGTSNSINETWNKPGVYEIMIVAAKGSCRDTMRRYIILPGSQPPNRDNFFSRYGFPAINDNSSAFTSARTGGYLIGGYTFNQDHGYTKTENGMLIKIQESGCIDWSRTMNAQWGGKIEYVKGLSDGSFVVSGYNDNTPYLLKLDQNGGLIWSRTYYCARIASHIQMIQEADDGGLILLSGVWAECINLIRTDVNGNIRYNKYLSKPGPSTTFYSIGGVVELNDAVYLTCGIQQTETNLPTKLFGVVVKIDDVSGMTVWSKKYQTNAQDISPRDIDVYPTGLLLNSFVPSNATQNINNALIFLDENGNITRSGQISTPSLTYSIFSTNAHVVANGGIMLVNTGTEYLSMQPPMLNHTVFIKLDASLNPKWAKDYFGQSFGQLPYNALGKDECIAAIGDGGGSVITPISSSSYKVQFGKIDSTGNHIGLSCALFDENVSVADANATSESFAWTTDSVVTCGFVHLPMYLNVMYPEVRYTCPEEFIDSCSFVKVTGDRSVCNVSNNYTYEAHKNRACGQPVKWELTGNFTVINKNDSSITVNFPAFGKYTIAAVLPFTCVPVKDSIVVNVAPKYPPPDLGKDTSICGNNTIILHASKYFASYQWQDGSTDSTFLVSAAGTYWVTVKDSCDNIFSDTVNFQYTVIAPVDIGADRNKCNNDTIHLQAPPGYLDYQWAPSYNISSTSSPLVTVNPDVDTFYFVRAEKFPGCFAIDTVHIQVNHSPRIDLGKDSSICNGDSLALFAGSGFASYSWSNGAATATIFAKTKGTYSVNATTIEFCVSKDTFNLMNVFNNPVVNLGMDNKICVGGTKELDAGSFVSYLWSTGSISRRIMVSDTGIYSVKVTDANNCKGSGSLYIPIALPLPSDFLPADTAICTYGKMILIPKGNYSSYNWISGEHTNTLTISKPGLYWLEVSDYNDCVGKDTILIGKKDCMVGFYIPNAFSPNGDLKNDVFRPLLFGNIQSFHFAVYDRWGGLVFDTTEPGKGWDGKMNGILKEAGTYVWMCTYQLEGEGKKIEKGTVQLLR